MTVTIGANTLARLLTDLIDTAGATGIRLDSHRAEIGDEPGLRDVLAGFSSTGFVIGHTWAECIGDTVSAVWPADAATVVVGMCKAMFRDNDTVTVDIDAQTAPKTDDTADGDHPGWTITVKQTPALFDSDTVFEFHADHAGTFAEERLWNIFTSAPALADARHVDSAQVAWSPSVIGPLMRIVKRRCTSKHTVPLRLFRTSDRAVHLVQIGNDWIGAAQPMQLLPPDDGEQPSIDPLLPVKVLTA